MAERTLVELRDEAGGPSHTGEIASVAESFVRFVATQGPYKTETLLFQQANGNDFKINDTIKSQLAHPLFATVKAASDAAGTAQIYSVEVNSLESNTNFKTVTLRDAEDIDSLGLVITIFGF
jgi:hypothetical protein